MGSAKAVSTNLFGTQVKFQVGGGVQLDFDIPDRFLQNQEEALFYHAYRETVLAHEAFQSRFSVELPRLGRVGLTSGFSLEDLPSNHLAYIRDAKHLSLQEIANLMGGVEGGITEKDWKHVRGRLPQNRAPHMRPLVYRNGQWVFVDWPDALKPPPNPLSPTEQQTWVRKRSLYFRFNISVSAHSVHSLNLKVELPLPSFLSFLVQP